MKSHNIWVFVKGGGGDREPVSRKFLISCSVVKDSPAIAGGNGTQHSCLENSIDRGAWQATVHGVAQSQTLLR